MLPDAADNDSSLSVAHGGPTTPSSPGAGNLPLEWFDSWVAETPDAPAVVTSDDVAWSYRELNNVADHLVMALRTKVGPGELVGVCLDRSPLLVAAAVALARLGAGYLPLGSAPPAARLQSLVKDNGIACLLSLSELSVPAGWKTHPVSEIPEVVIGLRDGGTVSRHAGVFYGITTSGSTGKPKIVLVSAEALGNLVRWTCDHLGIGPGSRATLLVSTTFDVHLIELWASLCSGAALCVAPDDARGSAAELFHWWQKLGLTHCVVLPTPLAELVFDRPWPAGLALRQLGVGGDRMRVRPPIDCTATVHNMYGPAEAAVITTSYQLERTPEAAGQPVPIGTPIKGVTVFVTDDNGRLLPRGTVGELRIGGAGLAIGYLDERLTADRFVPAPANQYGVQRVYRTGDRVLMRSDGLLEYFGRFDDQVKISGIRIEPGEVEAALEVHPSVNRAVVVTTSGVTGDLRLAAFVKLADNASEDAKGILRTARERLLEQAVPTILHFITDLPTTANGKVDRAILAERAAEKNANNVRDLESARSTTEAFLLATCQELLDAHDLSADDNLAASGGTSLAVARLIAVIEETYRIRLKAAQVMRQPDLRAVATLIDAQVQTHTS